MVHRAAGPRGARCPAGRRARARRRQEARLRGAGPARRRRQATGPRAASRASHKRNHGGVTGSVGHLEQQRSAAVIMELCGAAGRAPGGGGRAPRAGVCWVGALLLHAGRGRRRPMRACRGVGLAGAAAARGCGCGHLWERAVLQPVAALGAGPAAVASHAFGARGADLVCCWKRPVGPGLIGRLECQGRAACSAVSASTPSAGPGGLRAAELKGRAPPKRARATYVLVRSWDCRLWDRRRTGKQAGGQAGWQVAHCPLRSLERRNTSVRHTGASSARGGPHRTIRMVENVLATRTAGAGRLRGGKGPRPRALLRDESARGRGASVVSPSGRVLCPCHEDTLSRNETDRIHCASRAGGRPRPPAPRARPRTRPGPPGRRLAGASCVGRAASRVTPARRPLARGAAHGLEPPHSATGGAGRGTTAQQTAGREGGGGGR